MKSTVAQPNKGVLEVVFLPRTLVKFQQSYAAREISCLDKTQRSRGFDSARSDISILSACLLELVV